MFSGSGELYGFGKSSRNAENPRNEKRKKLGRGQEGPSSYQLSAFQAAISTLIQHTAHFALSCFSSQFTDEHPFTSPFLVSLVSDQRREAEKTESRSLLSFFSHRWPRSQKEAFHRLPLCSQHDTHHHHSFTTPLDPSIPTEQLPRSFSFTFQFLRNKKTQDAPLIYL